MPTTDFFSGPGFEPEKAPKQPGGTGGDPFAGMQKLDWDFLEDDTGVQTQEESPAGKPFQSPAAGRPSAAEPAAQQTEQTTPFFFDAPASAEKGAAPQPAASGLEGYTPLSLGLWDDAPQPAPAGAGEQRTAPFVWEEAPSAQEAPVAVKTPDGPSAPAARVPYGNAAGTQAATPFFFDEPSRPAAPQPEAPLATNDDFAALLRDMDAVAPPVPMAEGTPAAARAPEAVSVSAEAPQTEPATTSIRAARVEKEKDIGAAVFSALFGEEPPAPPATPKPGAASAFSYVDDSATQVFGAPAPAVDAPTQIFDTPRAAGAPAGISAAPAQDAPAAAVAEAGPEKAAVPAVPQAGAPQGTEIPAARPVAADMAQPQAPGASQPVPPAAPAPQAAEQPRTAVSAQQPAYGVPRNPRPINWRAAGAAAPAAVPRQQNAAQTAPQGRQAAAQPRQAASVQQRQPAASAAPFDFGFDDDTQPLDGLFGSVPQTPAADSYGGEEGFFGDIYDADPDDGPEASVPPRSRRSAGGAGSGGGRPPRRRQQGGAVNPKVLAWCGIVAVAIIVILFFVLFSGNDGENVPDGSSSGSASASSSLTSSSASAPVVETIPRDEWYMVLANRSSVLASDFTVAETARVGAATVDARIADALRQMINDAAAAGIELVPTSGYRTIARQQELWDSRVKTLMDGGLTQADAEAKAIDYTSAPGTSDHNTGLGVDILSADYQSMNAEGYAATAAAQWLAENAPAYGFILRYPADKTEATGMDYEPWHYRYVGVEQAQKITASGLCLEEYLAQ